MVRKIISRLGIELLAAIVIAVLSGIIISTLFSGFSFTLLHKQALSEDFEQKQAERTELKLQKFSEFIEKNDISSEDTELIDNWVRKQSDVMISIYDSFGNVVYDSNRTGDKKKMLTESEYNPLYTINLSDGTFYMEFVCLYFMHNVMLIAVLSVVLAFVTGCVIFLLFVKKKTDYIKLIGNDVELMESDINHPVTIKGYDEITFLAKSIDSMRAAILERQETDRKIQESGHKLVMAMSHDLRTPLTVLTGFLEILCDGKYSSEEKLKEYLEKSKDKAYRIKELSDKLFEYFLAYNYGERDIVLERDDVSVINELILDYIFPLTESGVELDYTFTAKGFVNLSPDFFKRIIENLFSNINKYAALDKGLKISVTDVNDEIMLYFENTVKPLEEKPESTNIGLDVCRRMTEIHNGKFESMKKDDKFYTVITLPKA